MKRIMGTDEDRQRVRQQLKVEKEGWRKERLIALSMGFSSENTLDEISAAISRSVPTIQRWFSSYRKGGLDAVLKRNFKGKKNQHYDEEVEAFLKKGLENARWNTAVQAQEALEKKFKKSFKYPTVWTWLKKCAGVFRVPRPVHEKRDSEATQRFKRQFLGHLKQVPVQPGKPVKIWFADESRYGLLPVNRRCWTKKGLRPHKRWQTRYDWSYCYGALDVLEGKSVFIQTPTVNLQWTHAFLEQIKKQYPDHEHIVVWDGAGFHPKDNADKHVPEGIYLLPLPPYSPELNPIEKLWDLIQDHTANKMWPSIERLDQVVASLLKDWWEDPARILRLVGRGWIRSSANASNNTI